MARIGDFREAFLSPELVATHGAEDGISNIRDAYTALKLVCWLNSVERSRFSSPYETKDGDAKFAFFLPRFGAVLANPEAVWREWEDEYKQVASGFDALAADPTAVETYRNVGLAVVRAPEPGVHYYSLFSHTIGYDTVLTVYEGQRYELESKYTQFVHVHSRPVWPRIDFGALARVLNRIEGAALAPQQRWACPRFTDTGPLLRLEDGARPLSKAQRYGPPGGRPHHASSLPPATLAALVVSYLEYGMRGLKPKRGGWSWDELQSLNSGIAWEAWEDTVLAQWARGELFPDGTSPAPAAAAAAAPAVPPLVTVHSGDFGPAGALSPGAGAGGGSSPGLPPLSRQGSLSAAAPPPRVGAAMTPTGFWEPACSEPSSIMSMEDVRSLAGAVPARLAPGRWQLLYGSGRDGISLRTLYRKAAGRAPTLLVVREAGPTGHIFGAFAAEPWKPHPRFYGTGETFVFTLQPQRVRYGWQRPRQPGSRSSGGGAPSPHAPSATAAATSAAAAAASAAGLQTDFFQFSTHEGLGVGGAGSYALWLDNELLEGASYPSATFGSPRLSSREEFRVAAVELWHM